MAETPRYAHLSVLLFLGSAFVIFVCVLIAIVSAISKAGRLTKFAAASAVLTAAGYAALLFTVALISGDKTLAAGEWKYFCEADCHIAYTIHSAETVSTLGPEAKPISAQGRFVVIRLKTWFDEHSIASFRGNSPLMPDPRNVRLRDDLGRDYSPQLPAAAALRTESTPLTASLRPGESYITTLVFDIPADAHNLKLLVADAEPITAFLIDHENSPLHGKIYLSLPAPHSAIASANP